MKILLGKPQVALRKCKGNSRSLNAGQLKSEVAIERQIHLNEGFQFLSALRGSSPYFENWDEKCWLIQSDPVTCARHFDYQISQFITTFLLSKAQPLGNISDWFYIVEYQQRGSPHIQA